MFRYFWIRTHGKQCQEHTNEFVSHIRVLNYVFVMNVAMIQPRNGYNQYYFALDSTFFEAKLTRPRPGLGQIFARGPRPRPKFWPRLNIMHWTDLPTYGRFVFYASCAAFDDRCHQQFCSHWSFRWCCHDWTTATPRCTVCPAIRSTDCSQSWMPLLDWSFLH